MLQLSSMTPTPGSDFNLRLQTNEMIERERLAALLAAIENAVRQNLHSGSRAYLLVGAVRAGSVDIALALGGIAATVIVGLPPCLVALKQLARDRRPEPNAFAVALADVMAFDATNRVDFIHKGKVVTIERNEVPFVQRIAFGRDIQEERPQAIRPEELQPQDESSEPDRGVEDEDQDWVPTLEAGDHPPREARAAPSGYFNSLTLAGEFETVRNRSGASELRFVPHDTSFAPYFLVSSNAYEVEPTQHVAYTVTGNIAVDPEGVATIEVLEITPPGDTFLTLRS